MKPTVWKAGVVICFLILLGGSTLHMEAGTSSFGFMHAWGNDDAYIGYRYAKNLAEGNGLVFNPRERVEGYTDPLYVVMLAPAFWVTNYDGIYFFSFFLNLVFAGAAFLLFVAELKRRLGESRALAGAILFALCLPLWVAVASGLETPQVLAISIAVWVMSERVASDPAPRDVYLLSLAMVLSIVARADGFIIVGIALFYLLIKRRLRAVLVCASVALATFGLFEVWRLAYYGSPLPTTYYIKVAGPFGARIAHAYEQLRDASVFEGLLPLLLAIPFALGEVIHKMEQGSTTALTAASPPAGQALRGAVTSANTDGLIATLAAELRFDMIFPPIWLAYWFYIGGDHFFDRFLIILYPLGIFTLLKFFDGKGKTLAYVVMVLALMEVLPTFKVDPRFQYQLDKYDCWIATGKFLGKNFPGKTLATGALGKIPFFSGLYTQDILGLTDPVLAHRPVNAAEFDPGNMKFDADYSLLRNPDVIANWIRPDLDMAYDLTQAKYRKAGYQIHFLAYTANRPPSDGIVNVQGWDDRMIQQQILQGYNFAVLVKR